MYVCVCVCVCACECACERVGVRCCMGLLFMDKLALSCQISPLWSLRESWLNESGRDFTNLQSCHWYILASNPLSPNFDLHSSWYQTPTAIQADKTGRHWEESSALGRSTSSPQYDEGWEEWKKKKDSHCLYIADRDVGRHWFSFLCSYLFGWGRSNTTLAPCCQSWHVILGNMEMNANGLFGVKEVVLEVC